MVRPQTPPPQPQPPARTHHQLPGQPLMLAAALLLLAAVAPSAALRCYRCGDYTDGVGSITPCLNYTAQKHLKECPAEANHCVKYVSEASIVRECSDKCVEKVESWGTNVYCCSEDACNGAPGVVQKPAATAAGAVVVALLGASAVRLLPRLLI